MATEYPTYLRTTISRTIFGPLLGITTSAIHYKPWTELKKVGMGAFAFCKSLSGVHLGAVEQIEDFAFYHCESLCDDHILAFPSCKQIGMFAFAHAYIDFISDVTFPLVTTVGYNAFYSCTKLREVTLPACTYVQGYAFCNCSQLVSIDLPACRTIDNYAFQGCSSLSSIDLPACRNMDSEVFKSCDALTEIHFAAANQATIEALSGYSSKFGATNATIYFDL